MIIHTCICRILQATVLQRVDKQQRRYTQYSKYFEASSRKAKHNYAEIFVYNLHLIVSGHLGEEFNAFLALKSF